MLSLPSLPKPSKIPFVHRIDVQQGNVIDQAMVAQLRKGMDKKKVGFIMGTPIIADTFHADRWDYVYTFQPGGGQVERRQITAIFVDGNLDHLEGDVKPAMGRLEVDTRQDTTIDVPEYVRKNFMTRLADKMPFTDDGEESADEASVTAAGEDEDTDAEAAEGEPAVEALTDADTADVADTEEEDSRATMLAASGGVIVPPDAPRHEEKKGFLRRFLDGVGLGAEDDGGETEYDPGDPSYRDVTNPHDL